MLEMLNWGWPFGPCFGVSDVIDMDTFLGLVHAICRSCCKSGDADGQMQASPRAESSRIYVETASSIYHWSPLSATTSLESTAHCVPLLFGNLMSLCTGNYK